MSSKVRVGKFLFSFSYKVLGKPLEAWI